MDLPHLFQTLPHPCFEIENVFKLSLIFVLEYKIGLRKGARKIRCYAEIRQHSPESQEQTHRTRPSAPLGYHRGGGFALQVFSNVFGWPLRTNTPLHS